MPYFPPLQVLLATVFLYPETVPSCLYIDSSPFIGGAQLSLLDDMGRDPGEVVLLSAWQYGGKNPWRSLPSRHWPATLPGLLQFMADVWRCRPILRQAIQTFRPDRIYLNTVRSGLLCLCCGLPFVNSHVMLRDRDIRMPWFIPKLFRWWTHLEISAISPSVAEKWKGRHVTIAENHLDEASIRLTPPFHYPFKGTIVVQVADFVPWKRHDLFLRALALARLTQPSIYGCIKGRVHTAEDQRWLKAIKTLQKELHLEDALLIDTQDISALPYISGAHILVSCAVDEPYGRAIQEARILGKTIIQLNKVQGKTEVKTWHP